MPGKVLSNNTIRYALLPAAGSLLLASFFLGLIFEIHKLYLLPVVGLAAYFAIYDFKQIYFGLLFFIPLTTKIYLSSAYALYVPGEILTITLMFVYLFYVLKERPRQVLTFLKHPLVQLIVLHVLWIGVTVVFAYKKFIAFKFLLAKGWFVITFLFVTQLILTNWRHFKKFFWLVLIPLVATVLLTLYKQYGFGFEFDNVNQAVQPFYRNHVNFAAIISLFYPFVWIATYWYRKNTLPYYFLWGARILLFVAIIYSYARGAWLALLCGVIFYWALRKKFVSWLIGSAVAIVLLLGFHFINDNNYLQYAPEYKKAVYHANISDHLQATININDVSTAERFFRWIGGVRMSTVNPITGFGPSNFYYHYKHYTVTAFTTYVSENPQKSGVHNYFLMTVIEQGFVGLLIFLGLTLGIFYYGTQLYRQTTERYNRHLVAALLVSMVIIYVQICLSDLIESFKIGSFYFMNIALLVNLDISKFKGSPVS